MSLRILISCAVAKRRAHLVGLLESLGGRVFEASTTREALAGARTAAPDVMLVSAEGEGTPDLGPLIEARPGAAIWLCGAQVNTNAQAQLEGGATDLLDAEPTREQLEQALAREVQRRNLALERDQLLSELEQLRGIDLIGRSRPMLRIHDQIQRIASTPRTTVLVTGEPGTGKETIARCIHSSSARARHAFVPVTCGEPDEVLAETLFYGSHVEDTDQTSRCAQDNALIRAEGGTLFLDEVGQIGLEMQERLLTLLQDRTWQPADGGEERHADIRFIASTSDDLTRLVAEGRFREDLYYRLNVLSADVPPLRDRGEDLTLLVDYFLTRIGREMGRFGQSLAPEAGGALAAHRWPGNLRELRNTLERGLIAAGGRPITCADLGLGHGVLPSNLPIETEDFRIRHMEEVLIRRALQSAGGNRSETARLLGVNRTTLYNKLRSYKISK